MVPNMNPGRLWVGPEAGMHIPAHSRTGQSMRMGWIITSFSHMQLEVPFYRLRKGEHLGRP